MPTIGKTLNNYKNICHLHKKKHPTVIVGCFLEDIIIYFITDWYLPFQNNSTIVTELQRDPIGSL